VPDLTPDPLELVPLGHLTIALKAPIVLAGCPFGTRVIVEVDSARLEGDRVQGSMTGTANADWLTVGADGTGALDVRSLMETDDGALVFCHYTGRIDLAEQTSWSTPLFETGDERYAWMNGRQFVAKGKTDGTTLVYEVFELA
jgi:Protein of unknown function (DUF3237)